VQASPGFAGTRAIDPGVEPDRNQGKTAPVCNHALRSRHVAKYAKAVLADLRLPEVELEFSEHAYPKYPGPVVIDEHGPVLQLQRWGVWPSYAREKPQYVTNARDDGLLTKAIWKQATAKRRCLIPATGYFEPGIGPPGARGELFFTLKDRPCFFFAGLWDQDPDGSGQRGYAMVTTTPNAYAGRFHDRMPVVLADADAAKWLGSVPLPPDQIAALCRAMPDDVMQHTEMPAISRKSITRDDLKSADGELTLF